MFNSIPTQERCVCSENTANPTAATKSFDTCCLATGARRSLVSTVIAVSYLYVLLPSRGDGSTEHVHPVYRCAWGSDLRA